MYAHHSSTSSSIVQMHLSCYLSKDAPILKRLTPSKLVLFIREKEHRFSEGHGFFQFLSICLYKTRTHKYRTTGLGKIISGARDTVSNILCPIDYIHANYFLITGLDFSTTTLHHKYLDIEIYTYFGYGSTCDGRATFHPRSPAPLETNGLSRTERTSGSGDLQAETRAVGRSPWVGVELRLRENADEGQEQVHCAPLWCEVKSLFDSLCILLRFF